MALDPPIGFFPSELIGRRSEQERHGAYDLVKVRECPNRGQVMLFPRLFRNVSPGPVPAETIEQLNKKEPEIQVRDTCRFEYVSAKDAGLQFRGEGKTPELDSGKVCVIVAYPASNKALSEPTTAALHRPKD